MPKQSIDGSHAEKEVAEQKSGWERRDEWVIREMGGYEDRWVARREMEG